MRKKAPYIFSLFVCLLLGAGPFMAQAQYMVPYRQFNVQDGLPSTHINKVYVDKRGFLWLSTDLGLSRFDGYAFRNFSIADGLTSLNVYSMEHSSDTTLWICTRGGGLFTLKNGVVKKYYPRQGTIPLKLIDLTIDSAGRIWLIDENNEAGFLSNDTFQLLNLRQEGAEKVYDILPYDRETIVLACNNGLYNWNKGQIETINLGRKTAIYCLGADKVGTLYCGAEGTIYQKKGSDISRIPILPGVIPLALSCNEFGELYGISSVPGFFRIHEGKYEDCGALAGLKDALIDDLEFDADGNLHLATFGRGLYTVFSFDILHYTAKSGLSHDNVTSLTGNGDGKIYIGTYGGVSVMENGQINPVPEEKLNPAEMVTSLLDDGGKLHTGIILRVHRFDRMLSPRRSPQDILCMLKIPGKIIFGTWKGVWETNETASDLLKGSQRIYPELENRKVFKIFRDSRQNLWFATDSGLYVSRQGQMQHFLVQNGLAHPVINDIAEDTHGNIWAATLNGLAMYDGRSWKQFTTSNGLNNNDCSSLFLTKNGILLVGTMAGLNYYNEKEGNYFERISALPKTHINCLYEDSRKIIWCGTDNGLYSFPESVMDMKKLSLRMYISRLRSGNRYYYKFDNLKLPYSQNNIQLHLHAIDFRTPLDLSYQYRIVDKQKDWNETPYRIIQFSGLASGEYTIELRARYKGANIFSPVTTVSFTIMKPFWEEWWFRLSIILLIASAIILIIQMRVKRIRLREQKRARRLSRIMRLKQQAMNALVNPHFIFNSLNSIQHFINVSDSLSANRYLTRFARLIRKTMDNSGKLYISLEDELERLQLYLSLEKMRLGNKFNYYIEMNETINPKEANIPSMLVQPYVENAIWHGIMPKPEGGNVWIRFNRLGDSLKISIEDSGVGIKPSEVARPSNPLKNIRGMQINQKRIGLMGKTTQNNVHITISNLNNQKGKSGTLIEIVLPYLKRSLESQAKLVK